MKVRQVLLARVIRQVSIAGSAAPRIDSVARIKERYHFMKAPERFEELYPQATIAPGVMLQGALGITFQEGSFTVSGKVIGIDLFQFLPNMIIADTRSSTEDTEAFLDDYEKWINVRVQDSITPIGPTYYVSNLEFVMDRFADPPAEYMEALRILNSHLHEYSTQIPKLVPTGFTFNVDAVGLGIMPPSHFTIERRAGIPHKQNIFFSQAPLKTKDHIAILEKLDRTLH